METVEINAKGLTIKQLNAIYTIYKVNHSVESNSNAYYTYQRFIKPYNWESSTYCIQRNASIIKFNLQVPFYCSNKYIAQSTIKSLISRNIIIPVYYHSTVSPVLDYSFMKISYYLIVNPKVVEWFSLDSQISYLLDSEDETNLKLAYQIIKGTKAFKKFTVPADVVANVDYFYTLPKFKEVSKNVTAFFTEYLLRGQYYSLKLLADAGYLDIMDIVITLDQPEKEEFYKALREAPQETKELILLGSK